MDLSRHCLWQGLLPELIADKQLPTAKQSKTAIEWTHEDRTRVPADDIERTYCNDSTLITSRREDGQGLGNDGERHCQDEAKAGENA